MTSSGNAGCSLTVSFSNQLGSLGQLLALSQSQSPPLHPGATLPVQTAVVGCVWGRGGSQRIKDFISNSELFYTDGRMGKGLDKMTFLITATNYLTEAAERSKLTVPRYDQLPWWGGHGHRCVRCHIAPTIGKQRETKVGARLTLSFLFGFGTSAGGHPQ